MQQYSVIKKTRIVRGCNHSSQNTTMIMSKYITEIFKCHIAADAQHIILRSSSRF